MRFVLLVLSLILSILSVPAQMKPVSDIQRFQQELTAANQKTATIECDFIQKKQLEMMKEPLVSAGKFYYRRPDMVCLNYTQEDPYIITLNGEDVKIVSNGKTSLYNARSNQIAATMRSMFKVCLFGEWDQASGDYQMTVYEDGNVYRTDIEPKNKRMKKYIRKIEVIFDKKDFTANQMTMTEPSGDYTQYVFSGKKLNLPLPEELFQIK